MLLNISEKESNAIDALAGRLEFILSNGYIPRSEVSDLFTVSFIGKISEVLAVRIINSELKNPKSKLLDKSGEVEKYLISIIENVCLSMLYDQHFGVLPDEIFYSLENTEMSDSDELDIAFANRLMCDANLRPLDIVWLCINHFGYSMPNLLKSTIEQDKHKHKLKPSE